MTKEYPDPRKTYSTIGELLNGVHEDLRTRGILPSEVTGVAGVCEELPYDGRGNHMYFVKFDISTKKGVFPFGVDCNNAFHLEFEEATGPNEKYKLALCKTAQVVGLIRSWLEEVCLDGDNDARTKIPAFINIEDKFVPLAHSFPFDYKEKPRQ